MIAFRDLLIVLSDPERTRRVEGFADEATLAPHAGAGVSTVANPAFAEPVSDAVPLTSWFCIIYLADLAFGFVSFFHFLFPRSIQRLSGLILMQAWFPVSLLREIES